MPTQLNHVIAAVFDRPWFLTETVLRQVAAIVTLHAEGGRLAPEEIEARVEAASGRNGPRAGGGAQGNVGIIPIYGMIFPRANLMTDFSGGATVDSIRSRFRAAMADDTIASILFDIDSPGGYVDGIDELASEIRAARGIKPIVSIADYGMASAAYYLGSQADEVVASPSAQVGWIGTVMVHQEFSKMDEMAGVTTTIFRNPAGKFGGNEYEPISEQASAEKQQTTDDYSNQFYAAVSKGRGVSVATVKSDFGAGGGMTAARAKAAGLVDRVETIDATIARMAAGKVKASSAQALGDGYRVVAAADVAVAAPGEHVDQEAIAADVDELALERAIASRRPRSAPHGSA